MKSLNNDVPTGLESLCVRVFKSFRVAHIHTVLGRVQHGAANQTVFSSKVLLRVLSISL